MSGTGEGAERPSSPDERYRLYIDESGDHVFNQMGAVSHRYLCLLGCWFKGTDYFPFHHALEAFKQKHIPHNPDDPVILHREDIINRRGAFWRLRDENRAQQFDNDFLELLRQTNFAIVGIVIDKKALREKDYPATAHPYHLAMGFLLQRYCGYLNHINRLGDVLAESRGGKEDRLLKESYEYVYSRGVWMTDKDSFQQALTSGRLKVRQKTANIAGLQIADLLSSPVRKVILTEKGKIQEDLPPFAAKLLPILEAKFNRHLYDGRIWGYGKVLFPK